MGWKERIRWVAKAPAHLCSSCEQSIHCCRFRARNSLLKNPRTRLILWSGVVLILTKFEPWRCTQSCEEFSYFTWCNPLHLILHFHEACCFQRTPTSNKLMRHHNWMSFNKFFETFLAFNLSSCSITLMKDFHPFNLSRGIKKNYCLVFVSTVGERRVGRTNLINRRSVAPWDINFKSVRW